MGLVQVKGRTLLLARYERVGECFDELSSPMVTINYDRSRDKFYQLMEAAFIGTLKRKQELQFKVKIARMPELSQLFDRILSTTISTPGETKDYAPPLRTFQVHAFIHGHEYYNELMHLNPDFNCTARKLRAEFNFKSYRSVAYLKKKLARKGIIAVEAGRCYTSQARTRLTHTRYKPFNHEKCQTVWRLPDALTVAAGRLVF